MLDDLPYERTVELIAAVLKAVLILAPAAIAIIVALCKVGSTVYAPCCRGRIDLGRASRSELVLPAAQETVRARMTRRAV